jgi:hypothetical protein
MKGVDGFNFRADAKTITFVLFINDRKAAPGAEVFLGLEKMKEEGDEVADTVKSDDLEPKSKESD